MSTKTNKKVKLSKDTISCLRTAVQEKVKKLDEIKKTQEHEIKGRKLSRKIKRDIETDPEFLKVIEKYEKLIESSGFTGNEIEITYSFYIADDFCCNDEDAALDKIETLTDTYMASILFKLESGQETDLDKLIEEIK